ncbi:trp operon leader peptide [Escherichia coli]|nr:trp operon leader peptide [Escherichia coli]
MKAIFVLKGWWPTS